MKTTRAALLLLLVVLASCSMPETGVDGDVGSMAITVDGAPVRTLLPPIDMTPVTYDITGNGPGGRTFSRTTTSPSVTIEGLAFGPWTVTALAKNAGNTVIGQGTGSVVVHTGVVSPLAITVLPLPGNGTLESRRDVDRGGCPDPVDRRAAAAVDRFRDSARLRHGHGKRDLLEQQHRFRLLHALPEAARQRSARHGRRGSRADRRGPDHVRVVRLHAGQPGHRRHRRHHLARHERPARRDDDGAADCAGARRLDDRNRCRPGGLPET